MSNLDGNSFSISPATSSLSFGAASESSRSRKGSGLYDRFVIRKKAEIRTPERRAGSLSMELMDQGDISKRVHVMQDRLSTDGGDRSYLQRCMNALSKGVNVLYQSVGIEANKVFQYRGVVTGHQEKIYSCAWSGNNEDFVSCSFDGKMLIWNKYDYNDPRLCINLRSPWVMSKYIYMCVCVCVCVCVYVYVYVCVCVC